MNQSVSLCLPEPRCGTAKENAMLVISLQAGQDVHVLVSGKECQKAAELAATVNGVTKVVQIEHEVRVLNPGGT